MPMTITLISRPVSEVDLQLVEIDQHERRERRSKPWESAKFQRSKSGLYGRAFVSGTTRRRHSVAPAPPGRWSRLRRRLRRWLSATDFGAKHVRRLPEDRSAGSATPGAGGEPSNAVRSVSNLAARNPNQALEPESVAGSQQLSRYQPTGPIDWFEGRDRASKSARKGGVVAPSNDLGPVPGTRPNRPEPLSSGPARTCGDSIP